MSFASTKMFYSMLLQDITEAYDTCESTLHFLNNCPDSDLRNSLRSQVTEAKNALFAARVAVDEFQNGGI